MSQQTLLFYDVETTGLHKCFDQVLQFAAIRTDLELNELSRHELTLKLNNDVVPSPEAIITHGIGLEQMQQGQCEVEAMKEIHQLLNQPGTLSLGYNTLGFDDELLRFSFYRNLLPPYTHQYANQCGRMDVYPLTVLYYLFQHDALNWPLVNGAISLKLEQLSQANQLSTGCAHNALVDVEATIALAKLLRKNKKMWDYACGYFHKQTDIDRTTQLPIFLETDDCLFRDAFIVSGKFGAHDQFIAPVISLGQHQHYKNQTLWLRLDTDALQKTTHDNIPESTFIIRKKMGEQVIVLPTEKRYGQHISAERQKRAHDNKQRLLKDPSLLGAIASYHQQYKYPFVANVDIDADLYNQPFPKPYEEQQYRHFHTVDRAEKLTAAKQFSQKTRQQQAQRIIGRHYSELLSAQERDDFNAYCQTPAVDFRGHPKLTWAHARERASQLLETGNLTDDQTKLLREIV